MNPEAIQAATKTWFQYLANRTAYIEGHRWA